jgi:hypothetical protein
VTRSHHTATAIPAALTETRGFPASRPADEIGCGALQVERAAELAGKTTRVSARTIVASSLRLPVRLASPPSIVLP